MAPPLPPPHSFGVYAFLLCLYWEMVDFLLLEVRLTFILFHCTDNFVYLGLLTCRSYVSTKKNLTRGKDIPLILSLKKLWLVHDVYVIQTQGSNGVSSMIGAQLTLRESLVDLQLESPYLYLRSALKLRFCQRYNLMYHSNLGLGMI